MKMQGFAAFAIACYSALAAAGCCCGPRYCGDYGPHDIVAASCEPACAPVAPAAPACAACGINGPCPKHHGSQGLFGYLREAATCGAGCGEFYVHPWINDPPKACDPCDHYGNWTGPRSCGPPHAKACPTSWRGLWGHRADLAACGCGAHAEVHGAPYEGRIIEGHITEGSFPAGTVSEGPTLAEPIPTAPPEAFEDADEAPVPPQLPGPTTRNATPKTRSALKKIDGQPAVYYSGRPLQTATR